MKPQKTPPKLASAYRRLSYWAKRARELQEQERAKRMATGGKGGENAR